MQCTEIRQKFVEYYQDLGFQLLPRASMLHPSIPMSFVMSAGLVQVETSLANVKNRSGDKFVLVQDCFRHFDLETIGTDNIHLSLFEMPAAFIFGNNGRKKTISAIWKLATEVLGIDLQRLWVSYFDGGELVGHHLSKDELTTQAWLDVGVPEDRLVGLGIGHNYWIQGGGIHNGSSLRKCGANTELFYDMGEEHACSPTCQPGCRCDRFVEFSNSLFVSHHFDHNTNQLTLMEDPFTETVIGSERVAMILQKAPSVFDTDEYRPIIEAIHQFASYPDVAPELMTESTHVIADHLRALCVLIADGAPPPGIGGRKRIIKLLIRRILTRQILLGIFSKEFLPALIQKIDKINEIDLSSEAQNTLLTYFDSETECFEKTIQRARRAMEKMLKDNQEERLSGQQMLSLEKQWGLPYLLIARIMKQKGLSWLEKEYKEALNRWKLSVVQSS